MYSDSELEELWRIKDENAEKDGGDIRIMANALREEQINGGRTVVSFDSSTEQPPERFPVFHVQPGAHPINIEDVRKLEDEE